MKYFALPRRNLSERVRRRLSAALESDFNAHLRLIKRASPAQVPEHLRALGIAAQVRDEVRRASVQSCEQLAVSLERCSDALSEEQNLHRLRDDVLLGQVGLHLAKARRALGVTSADSQRKQQVTVPTDFLFQLHQSLFPAERMAVGAGRQVAGGLLLGASFDVTSKEASRTTYSRADPKLLSEALLAMERSGTQLGLWAHSHPGSTSLATHPSDIDRKQWAAWSEDFPSLLGAILTADGHVRFWGEPLEGGALQLHLCGSGYERIDTDVYRISSQTPALGVRRTLD